MATLLDFVISGKVVVDTDILLTYGSTRVYYNNKTGYVQLYFGCVRGISDLRLLHREIMQAAPHQLVDHISRVRSDCTRSNLRFATAELNGRNKSKALGKTSSHLGVSYRADRDKWRAYGSHEDKYIHLGYFKTEQLAVEARERWLKSVAHIIA